jgi:uncharacterized membrane protein YhdT
MVSASIFMLVAALHAVRLAYLLPAKIGPLEIPVWFSAAALVLSGLLAFWGFAAGRRYRHYE